MSPKNLEITGSLLKSITSGTQFQEPFRHWQLEHVFPEPALEALLALPVIPPDITYEKGTRESNNATRTYFDPSTCAQFAVAAAVTTAFQNDEVVTALGNLCGLDLSGNYLRVEYAQDRSGFWLNPHTDIRVKKMSLLIYLSQDGLTDDLGTDIYDGDRKWVRRVPFAPNRALLFVPADDTWHGFEKRPIEGVRRTLIVNYVTDEWRDRHELAYPASPIRAAA